MSTNNNKLLTATKNISDDGEKKDKDNIAAATH